MKLTREDIKAIAEEVVKLQKADENFMFYETFSLDLEDYLEDFILRMIRSASGYSTGREKEVLKDYNKFLKKRIKRDIKGVVKDLVEAVRDYAKENNDL